MKKEVVDIIYDIDTLQGLDKVFEIAKHKFVWEMLSDDITIHFPTYKAPTANKLTELLNYIFINYSNKDFLWFSKCLLDHATSESMSQFELFRFMSSYIRDYVSKRPIYYEEVKELGLLGVLTTGDFSLFFLQVREENIKEFTEFLKSCDFMQDKDPTRVNINNRYMSVHMPTIMEELLKINPDCLELSISQADLPILSVIKDNLFNQWEALLKKYPYIYVSSIFSTTKGTLAGDSRVIRENKEAEELLKNYPKLNRLLQTHVYSLGEFEVKKHRQVKTILNYPIVLQMLASKQKMELANYFYNFSRMSNYFNDFSKTLFKLKYRQIQSNGMSALENDIINNEYLPISSVSGFYSKLVNSLLLKGIKIDVNSIANLRYSESLVSVILNSPDYSEQELIDFCLAISKREYSFVYSENRFFTGRMTQDMFNTLCLELHKLKYMKFPHIHSYSKEQPIINIYTDNHRMSKETAMQLGLFDLSMLHFEKKGDLNTHDN